MKLQKERSTERISFREFTLWKACKDTRTLRPTEHKPILENRTDNNEEDSDPMALSDAAREWFTKNSLEGFLYIADAPPHEELEHVAPTNDLAEITEGTIQALTRLQARELQSVESPSTEILMEYFGEYSLSSKAYRTQGGEDLLFWEVARVLLEYGFYILDPQPCQNTEPDSS